MKSHPALLASLLLGLWALAWLALGTGGCSTGWPANTPIDRDGDGLPDYVHVDDFDRDGTLEMDDLQAAMDALTDPGPKTLEAGVGLFRRPQSPGTHPGK